MTSSRSEIGLQVVNTARPGRFVVDVVENRSLSRRYFLLVLSRPAAWGTPRAGTFLHLMVPNGRFFLRRPFSVMDFAETTMSLIVVEKGEGTQILRRLRPGQTVDIIGPLGSEFPRVPGRRVLALGGGVGLAPLYYYAVHRDPSDCAAFHLLYGARNREDLFVDNFDWGLDDVEFSSDDGSYGLGGTVIDLARTVVDRAPVDVIFSCGPNPMLKAAHGFASELGLPHFVSLENRMACALGACRSCVVATSSDGTVRYKTVCNDGPVFDASALVWEELPQA